MKKYLALVLAIVVACSAMVGCSSAPTSAATPSPTPAPSSTAPTSSEATPTATGELNIYTTVSDLQYNAIVGAFSAKYPGVKINYTQAGAGESKSRIKAEKDNPQGDVMFGGLVYADTLAYGDLFEKYISPGDAKLPDSFKNSTGALTYHDTQIPCLWVNDKLEKDIGITVTSYTDLLDPKFKGKLVNADPTASSSAWNQLQCILTGFGGWDNDAAWDYVNKMMDNLVITEGSSAVYKGVFNGEYAVGMTYEPACVQMLSEGAEGVHIVYPKEGVTSISFGSAIIKGAKNLDNGKLFIDFLISDECQTIYNQCGARQANADLKIDNKWLPALDTINYLDADTKALADNQTAIFERWTSLWQTKGK